MRKTIPGKAWHWVWKGLLWDDWLASLRHSLCPLPVPHFPIPTTFIPFFLFLPLPLSMSLWNTAQGKMGSQDS